MQFFGAQTGLLTKRNLVNVLKKAPKKLSAESNYEFHLFMKTFHEILADADARHVAVGHFNISDLGALKAIFAGGSRLSVPVLIGVSEGRARIHRR